MLMRECVNERHPRTNQLVFHGRETPFLFKKKSKQNKTSQQKQDNNNNTQRKRNKPIISGLLSPARVICKKTKTKNKTDTPKKKIKINK